MEKQVTLEKMGETSENGSHLEKGVTVGRARYVTLEKKNGSYL